MHNQREPFPMGWRAGLGRAWPGLLAGVLALSWAGYGALAGDEFLRRMNLGKAFLENRDSAKAIESFAQAVQLEPNSAPAQRNLARAYMLANQLDQAMSSLLRARALESNAPGTVYLLGLVHARKSKFPEAVKFFEEAVRLDPNLAPLRFQLANAYQLTRQNEKALVQLREAVRLDPLHASAHFKLAALARQRGDSEAYRMHQESFLRLRGLFGEDQRTPTALERCIYTRPESVPAPPLLPGPGLAVRFVDASATALPPSPRFRAMTASVLDVRTNGVVELILIDPNGSASLWTMPENSGRFVPRPLQAPIDPGGIYPHAMAGNFKDDPPAGVKYDPLLHARNDLLLFGPKGLCLLQRAGPDLFSNVTAQAGLAGVGAVADAAWMDYDHDGDLDLGLASGSGWQLWQNNGNGRFENATTRTGLLSISGVATSAVGVAAADLDGNQGIDLLLAGGPEALSRIFMNQRTGQFRAQPEPPGPAPAALGVVVNDLDNDGAPDVLWWKDRSAVFKPGGRGGEFSVAFDSVVAHVVALVDYDNDGWLDLLAGGHAPADPNRGRVALWRNEGSFRWKAAAAATGLDTLELPPVGGLVSTDFDRDGDTDLFLWTADGSVRFLRNDGGQAHGMLQVRLQGTKTNPMGLGTRLEVRAGPFWVSRVVSQWPVEIGLGSRRRLDSVKTIWTNGIEDNETDVLAGPHPLTILEKNVAAGSCPYLYVWDGQRFRFVTDLLGNSPLGLSVRRGVVLPADPDEWVWVGDQNTVQPREGFYEVQVTEELREVLYLDTARWMAIDHPASVEVHSNDKLGPPPFAVSALRPLEGARKPSRVAGDDGLDRTEAVQDIDGIFSPPGPLLPPPLRGMCRPLALTLDFGELDSSRPWILALTGWLQYGDASVNIAASQNEGLPVIPPCLEAQGPEGPWVLVDPSVGMPSGKTKTILCDLSGKLPARTQRLRLTTTFEIRWDRILLGLPVPASQVRCYSVEPHDAHLYWRGFSDIRSRGPGHPATPDFDRVSPRPPWRTTPQGWCTRYGDVLALVQARDQALVLVNGGDALRIRFSTQSLPAVPEGHVRSFYFYSVGWDKDSDPNVVDGDRVEPLPVTERADWVERYNTRWVPGQWPVHSDDNPGSIRER